MTAAREQERRKGGRVSDIADDLNNAADTLRRLVEEGTVLAERLAEIAKGVEEDAE